MKKVVFYVIIDTLNSNLNERKKVYHDINTNFGFLFNLKNMDTLNLHQSTLNIVNTYTEDLDTSFIEEIIHFQKNIETFQNNDLSMNGLLQKLLNSPLRYFL